MTEHSSFRPQLDQLKTIILDGLSYFLSWHALNREYELSIQSPGIRDFWWQYRGFLGPARKALFLGSIMQFSKAYDSDPRNISIRRLLRTALENPEEFAPHATGDGLSATLERIDTNTQLLERLRRYRNKRMAHYDSDFRESVEFPSEDLQTLVEETKSILNSIRLSYDGTSDDFDDIMEDVACHTSRVINTMKATESGG